MIETSSRSLFHQSICSKHKGARIKQKILFHKNFYIILIAYFKLRLIHQVPHFGAILPNVVATGIIEQIVQKLLCFEAKNVGKIDP